MDVMRLAPERALRREQRRRQRMEAAGSVPAATISERPEARPSGIRGRRESKYT